MALCMISEILNCCRGFNIDFRKELTCYYPGVKTLEFKQTFKKTGIICTLKPDNMQGGKSGLENYVLSGISCVSLIIVSATLIPE